MAKLPSTTQSGLVATSVGDGQDTAVWATPTSAGYASLTGTGETATPGDLTQSGGLTINVPSTDTMGVTITQNGSGGVVINDTSASNGIWFTEFGTGGIFLHNENSGEVTIAQDGTGGIQIEDRSTGGLFLTSTSSVTITGNTSTIYNIGAAAGAKIGFFGNTPVIPQVSGGTLSGVIAGLVALGLFSS